MDRGRLVGCLRLMAAAAALAPAMFGVASAAPAHGAAASPEPQPFAAHGGYTQVDSALMELPTGGQASAHVSCPSGTSVVGGGMTGGGGVGMSVNTSIPLDNGWAVYVNNTGPAGQTWAVVAVCVKKVSKYSVVAGATVTNPAGALTEATASCPAKTVAVGGGAVASGYSIGDSLHSSYPDGTTGWLAQAANTTSTDENLTAYVVCAKKPSGYAEVSSSPVSVPSGGFTPTTEATCPSKTVALGGGGYASLPSTAVTLHLTFPENDTEWAAGENDTSGASTYLYAYAICAKL